MQAEAPQVTTQPAWRPPALRSGEKVLGYTSATTMLVDEPGTSSNVLVESSWPLVTENDHGALAPTDITLQPLASGGWVPANSPLQTVIGQDLTAGVTLGSGAGALAIHPGGTRTAAGVRSANKVFYANTDTDIDTIVEPMPNGLGLNWTLRSPAASEQTSMTLDLPAGVTLLAMGTSVNLMQSGRVVGMVSPPIAWDTQNTQIPVRYEVSGSTITVTTSHQGRDLAYPVSVDPIISYDSGAGPLVALDPGGYPGPPQTANWAYDVVPGYGPYFGYGFSGGRFVLSVSAGLGGGNAVLMNSRANAFITRVDFPDLRFNAATNVCAIAGLWNRSSSNPGGETGYSSVVNGPSSPAIFYNCTGFGQTYLSSCASSVCDPAQGTTGNSAGVNLAVVGAVSGSGGIMSFTGAYLFWNDHDAPVMTDAVLPTGWTNNPNPSVWVHLHDNGLGVGTDTPHGDHRDLAWGTIDNDPTVRTAPLLEDMTVCDGTLNGQCYSDGSAALAFSTIPDGVRTVHITGRDILGHTTTTDRTMRVDTRGPAITTTGRLADLGRSTAGSEPSRSVSKTVHMTAIASDASPTVSTSGLSSFTLTATQPGHPTVTQVGGSTVLPDGSWKIDYDFAPSGWNQGPVTFTLTANDVAGNVSAANTFTVNVARGDITTLIEGQKTAKRLVLQAEDLKPASPASTVVFQYRTKTTAWQNIPAARLQAMDGSSVSSNSFAVSSSTHRSPQVVYNITDHTNAAQVYVRGYFSAATGDTTDDVLTGIDTTGLGTSDAMADFGPGQVDELTGNFQLAATDVDIDSYKAQLGITRTYNSRPLTLVGVTYPFGPGWTLGMPVDDDASIYTKVIDYNASGDPDTAFLGAAEVDTSDGEALPFEEHETDNGYYSLPELDSLSLKRQVDANGNTTSFTLKDSDSGQTLVFGKASGNPGEWTLSSVQETTSAVATTFRYSPGADGRQKLTDIVAPSPVDCSGANLTTTAGCRSLHLTWNSGWTRVTSIDFVAPGNGLTNNKVAVAAYTYDSNSRLSTAYDPREGAALATQYNYDSFGRLATITPPGENAWTLTYQYASGEPASTGRVVTSSRSQPVGSAGTPTTAKEVILPSVAVRGSGAPYDMSANALAAWSQVDDIPTDATAIFRPDDVPSNPPSSYAKATIHYLDALGRLTNEVRPGGETTTTEHDAAGNATRTLSAVNRATALSTGTTTAAHAARAQELSTIRTFGERTQGSGWRLLDEKGPLHSTRLANGTTVQARKHTVNTYNDSDPDSKSLNAPTKSVTSAYVAGTGDTDARTRAMTYNSDGQQTSSAVDPAGLNLVTRTEFNSFGLVTYQEMPRSASQTAASTRRTIFYSAGTNAEDAGCSNKPAWANLSCKTVSGGQPTSTLPKLPASVYEYDAYQHQTKKTDYVDGISRRVRTDSYNGNRHTSQTVTGTTGDARPQVDYGYSPTTGRLLTTTAQSSPAKTVTRAYNAVGQISTYTDADSGTTTSAYDTNGRTTSITDPSGTRTIAYDATTGRPTSITEPQLGAITTAFNADGALTSEVFPNANVKLNINRDETGTVTGRSYVKQSPCSSGCTAYSDGAARSIHDQWLTETGTDKTRTYAYDAVGRLSSSSDAPGGTACVTKTYTYDADGNRLTRKTYPAGTGGACSTSTTPTTQTLTYDEADRLNNSSYAYDTLGRIITVPAGDAGGTNAMTSSYYIDDRAHTLTQGSTTTTLDLDPVDRVRQRTVGAGAATVNHYGDDTDEPAWTIQGSTTIRNSEDATGDVVATVGPSGGGSSSWTAPTTTVLDNFDRADGSLGSNWGTDAPGAIASNRAKIDGSPWGYAWWNASSYTGPGEVYMTVPTVDTTTGSQLYLTIVSGWSSGNLNGYELTLNRDSTNDSFQISKYTNNNETALGSAQTITGHLAAGDKIALTRETGGLLKTWRSASGSSSWTQIGSTVTDTTYFNAGQQWQIGWGNTGNTYRIDDFGGGQTTPAASTATKLKISDLHGDVVSEVPNTSGATASLLAPVDIFGAPITAAGANLGLGYLGAKKRNTSLATGTIEMGARLYQPQIGRFLQTDPIYGGSLNTYDYANQDPANQFDLEGEAGGPVSPCGKQTCGQVANHYCDNHKCPQKNGVWKTLQVGCGVYSIPKGVKALTKRTVKVISQRIPEYAVPVVGEVCAGVGLITIWSKIF